MEQTNPQQDAQQVTDLNPKVTAWLKDHPTPEDTLALPAEKQREFISLYYAPDDELDEQIEKMLDDAETAVDSEIEAGKSKFPFSEKLVIGLITISKVKVLDEMIEDVSKHYEDRRKQVKDKEITDPQVAMVTQMSCAKMAMMLQGRLIKQIEQEVKSRELPLQKIMRVIVGYLMGDLSMFVEVEKFYNLRKVEQHKDRPCDIEKLRKYIRESIKISDLIVTDKISQNSLFLFPHILSDKLFNETGYESEEIVYYIRQLNDKAELDEETIELIVREAYAVEKSKEKCFKTFDDQMKKMEEQMIAAEAHARKQAELQKKQGGIPGDIRQDKAMMKMMQMGLNVPGGPGGIPPGMIPPGMMPVPIPTNPPAQGPVEQKKEEGEKKEDEAEEKKEEEKKD